MRPLFQAGLALALGAAAVGSVPLPQQAVPAALTMFASADIGQALFYAMPDMASAASFRAHAGQIGMIAPQSFALTSRGELRGTLPTDLAEIAQAAAVPIMPLVINAGFSRTNAIKLLRSATARDQAIGALVEQARDLSLAGWQIDFEGLPSTQRAAFTRFVREVADALHRHGKLLSVAVAARTSDDPASGNWKGFSGVYDYAGLADSADFLSVMAYPESDATHPGPLASAPWVEQVVQHVLETVPADKISLGLPTYQTDWMERRVRVSVRKRVAGKVKRVFHTVYKLFHRSGPAIHTDDEPLEWDPTLESSYRIEGEGHHRQITWVEDERSFAAKIQLVSAYHLRGFSVWRIGLEDPHIWGELPDAPRQVAAPADSGPVALVTGHARNSLH